MIFTGAKSNISFSANSTVTVMTNIDNLRNSQMNYQPLTRKSNGVISSADADFCLYETDNPYDDDDNNNDNQDDYKKGIFEQEEAQLQRKGARVRFPQPYSFLFMILFKLKLGSTPIFKFGVLGFIKIKLKF